MDKKERMVLLSDTGEEIVLEILEVKIIGEDAYCIAIPEGADMSDGLLVLQAFDTKDEELSEYKLVTDKELADKLVEDFKANLLNNNDSEVL